MPVITSSKSKPEYDVWIIGSGAGGAQVAYTLTLQGLKCVMLVGIYGTKEGIENTPDSPEGVLHPAPKLRAAELLTQKHRQKIGVPVILIHRAAMTKPLDAKKIVPKLHPGNVKAQKLVKDSMSRRAACFWAPDCCRGCSIGAAYQ